MRFNTKLRKEITDWRAVESQFILCILVVRDSLGVRMCGMPAVGENVEFEDTGDSGDVDKEMCG